MRRLFRRTLVWATFPVFVSGCRDGRSAQSAPQPARAAAPETVVKLTKPRVETLHRNAQIPGTIEPLRRVEIRSRVSGVVAEVRVDRGDRVKKGQLLARIQVPEMVTDVERIRAAVKVAEAEVKRDELHAKRLADAARVSRDAIAPARLEAAEAATVVARAKVAGHRATLLHVEGLARDTVIRAPFEGVVTARHVDPGALVHAGSGLRGASATLVTIEDQRTLRVIAHVAEADAPEIRFGMPATLTARADPGRHLDAKVSRTASAIDAVTRTLRVEIDLANGERGWISGMETVVTIPLGARQDALTLPAEAVRRDARGTYLWIIDAGRAVRRDVAVGIDSGARVEIRSGLRAGDNVVHWGHALLEEGKPVRAEATP